MSDRDRDPLEWLRRIVVKGHPSGTVGGETLRHGIISKVVPALIDVAAAARRLEAARQAYRGTHEDARASAGAAIDWREANAALLATIREQMERADG